MKQISIRGNSYSCHLLSLWFLARLILLLWRWRRYFPPKRRLTFNGLHCVKSQKIVLFITTAVRISNPIILFQVYILNSISPTTHHGSVCEYETSHAMILVISGITVLYWLVSRTSIQTAPNYKLIMGSAATVELVDVLLLNVRKITDRQHYKQTLLQKTGNCLSYISVRIVI
jgi:hypothetical protein